MQYQNGDQLWIWGDPLNVAEKIGAMGTKWFRLSGPPSLTSIMFEGQPRMQVLAVLLPVDRRREEAM